MGKKLEVLAEDKEKLVQTYAGEVALLASDLRRCAAEKEDVIAQAQVIERQRQEEADDRQCVICSDRRREMAFLPCGHVVVCRPCASHFSRMTNPQCPNCRGQIEQIWA